MVDVNAFRRDLLRWYGRNARALPWRTSTSLWPVLVSEFMLQQTRVEAAIPYFERFMARFPHPGALALAAEADVLAAWSGLGYYSRARNLRDAATRIAEASPQTYDQVRALPGVGPYTAAAVSSIALGLPFAAVDGNVLRVLARVTADAADIGAGSTRARFRAVAQAMLAPDRPGDFNQSMMELGATVCLPRAPRCLICPVSEHCAARQSGRQHELPVKRPRAAATLAEAGVVVVRRGPAVLLKRRAADESRMPGFWELPHPGDLASAEVSLRGSFRHTIVNTRFLIAVFTASPGRKPRGLKWVPTADLAALPLTTITRKALNLVAAASSPSSREIQPIASKGQ